MFGPDEENREFNGDDVVLVENGEDEPPNNEIGECDDIGLNIYNDYQLDEAQADNEIDGAQHVIDLIQPVPYACNYGYHQASPKGSQIVGREPLDESLGDYGIGHQSDYLQVEDHQSLSGENDGDGRQSDSLQAGKKKNLTNEIDDEGRQSDYLVSKKQKYLQNEIGDIEMPLDDYGVGRQSDNFQVENHQNLPNEIVDMAETRKTDVIAKKLSSSTLFASSKSNDFGSIDLSNISVALNITAATRQFIEQQLVEAHINMELFDAQDILTAIRNGKNDDHNPTAVSFESLNEPVTPGSMAPIVSKPEYMLDVANQEMMELFNYG